MLKWAKCFPNLIEMLRSKITNHNNENCVASKDFRDLFQAIIASCFQHLVPDVMIRELKCSQEARRTEGAEKMVIPRY